MRSAFLPVVASAFGALITACDPLTVTTLVVENKCSEPVKVDVYGNKPMTFTLKVDADTIIDLSNRMERRGYLPAESLPMFYDSLVIVNEDSVRANSEVDAPGRWQFQTQGDYDATYTLTITDDDF